MSTWEGYHGRKYGPRTTRDFQRQRCYDWETHVLSYQTPTWELDQCAQLIGRVCQALQQKPPVLGDGRGCGRGFADAERIVLVRYYRAPEPTLHELAHTFTERARPGVWHDGLWLRTYIELLARFVGYDRGFLLRSARSWGLKVDPRQQYAIAILCPAHRWQLVAPIPWVSLMDGNVVLLGKTPRKVPVNLAHRQAEQAQMAAPDRMLRQPDLDSAAGLLRLGARKGWFGGSDTKLRRYVLEAARVLEKKGDEHGW
jgi:hypothetical protein